MCFHCILMLHAAPIITQKPMQVNASLSLFLFLNWRQVVLLFLFYLASHLNRTGPIFHLPMCLFLLSDVERQNENFCSLWSSIQKMKVSPCSLDTWPKSFHSRWKIFCSSTTRCLGNTVFLLQMWLSDPSAGRKQFARHEWAQKAAYLLGCTLEELSSAIFKPQGKGTLPRSASVRQSTDDTDSSGIFFVLF